jgi:hypothetical protein
MCAWARRWRGAPVDRCLMGAWYYILRTPITDASRLLPARSKRPRCRRATQRGYEFSPSDVDCHVTLQWGVMPIAMEGGYHAFIARSEPERVYFRPAFSRIADSVARPLSVSVYAPLSRLCAMNPRTAMDCIACGRMPTAA